MNKQQLAAKIWQSANKMRSKIEANEYKDYILGFIFYKFLSDKEEEFLIKDGWTTDDMVVGLTEEDPEVVSYCQKRLGYFISYDNLFSTWLAKGKDFDVSNVTDALSAFARLINESHKKVFDKIFDTLSTGLSKLGENSGARTKAISDLIYLIKDIPMDDKQDYDVLGFIYEYLISNFAANAGKKAGEFYTPYEVSYLMSEIVAYHLREKEKIEIYDPTSGSGSLLINIGKAISKYIADKNNIMYYAQELKENTYNLTRMNLVMRGILPDNIITRNGDTLAEDWPYFDEADPQMTYDPLYVDAVVSNPPYSQKWEPEGKDTDPRYARYGLAPKGKADYAFLLHDLYHIKPDGIMTIVLPHGVLFRGGEEERIRRNLIENNNIDAIIGLPANMFFGTGIPTIIMVLKQKRANTDVLIIDASKGFAKEGKNNKLRASDIRRIVDAYVSRSTIDKFSRLVTRDEIRANEYNLNIPRYVDSSEEAETWDIYATMFGGIPNAEIDMLHAYWDAFSGLRETLFVCDGTPYSRVAVANTREAILSHASVVGFIDGYRRAFDGFEGFLHEHLITSLMQINPGVEESIIGREIFARLDAIPLVDKYVAYQYLNDEWKKISTDLEILQTEGILAATKVDPNLVIKKKGDKEEEVQDGWVGRVIPFELVQEVYLPELASALKVEQARLSEVDASIEEMLEEFTEDEKQENENCFNEDNTAFVNAEIKRRAKALAKSRITYAEDTFEAKVLKLNALLEEQKDLKASIKERTQKLITASKETIEGLQEDEIYALLHKKWISPLMCSLEKMPEVIVTLLVSKIKVLAEKYETTLLDIDKDLSEAESALGSMLDELTGNEYDMKGLEELRTLLLGI